MMTDSFLGYARPDGRVGVRNLIAVIPSVLCASHVAAEIAAQVEGAVALHHPLGCAQVGKDLETTARTLIAMGRHPNVAAVLVVGLGCERFTPDEFVEGIRVTGKPVEKVVIQEAGDTLRAIEQGVRIVSAWSRAFSDLRPQPHPLSKLVVGLKCGGTDATSGLAANPALGAMSDRIVDGGGTVILSELNELIGSEDYLAARAASPEIARRVYEVIYAMEDRFARMSGDPRYEKRKALISTGNFDGGVSTIVEKALGGVHKSGHRPVIDVIDYAEPSDRTGGVLLMDSPSHDGEVVTGMVGAGAQIVVFTTGRGTPVGFPFVPVIKVTGNSRTYERMQLNLDFNAGGILDGTDTIDSCGEQLYRMVLETANGRRTRAESLRHDELFCITRF